jgi:hypothetical protein
MARQIKDLKEQLTPIAARLREGRSVIRHVSQVTLRLKPLPDKDRFASTVDGILRWMNQRAGRSLPDAAWQRHSFELSDVGTQRTAAVALANPRYWAARLDDADKTVPMRTWVTEIGVGIDDGGDILFGTRLICVTRGADEAFDRSIPGFTRPIITSGPAELDGVSLEKVPRLLATESDVADLVRLLELPTRQAEVIVFALPENSTDISETVVSASAVSAKLLGVAHVFILSGPASFILTDAVGRELSVFRQAVRTYRPGFSAWLSQPTDHPLALPARISNWNGEGPDAFERWLVNQSFAFSVRSSNKEDLLPAFNSVRQLAAQLDRKVLKASGGTDAELLRLYEDDNARMQAELKEQKELYEGILSAAEVERDSAVRERDAAKAQALERLHRLRLMEQRLSNTTEGKEQTLPTSLDSFEEWCLENLVGSVELVSRAYQGVRKSNYHDPQFIYKTMLLLRDYYVPMRRDGSQQLRTAYEAALKELQLEESATGDGIKYAADLYSVQYGSSRIPLDRHLKGSDSRDRRFGFRAYFFWDDEGQVAVVGWLPSHLDNRAS